jgi:hypothetical protein
MNAFWGGLIGGVAGGLLAVLLFGHHRQMPTPEDQLAAMAEVRREQMTETDIANEKMIATSLEEYAVDNGGKYPPTLGKLVPTYVRSVPFIPGSDPPTLYRYEFPAENPAWGLWDIKDDGSCDPTLYKLLNVTTKRRCTKETCRYIIYAQNLGVVGVP